VGADSAGTFKYANPGRIHWGAGCLPDRLADELEVLGAQRVFVISTQSVAGNAELGGRLSELLGQRQVGRFDAIGQHAPAASVVAAVEAARQARPDLIVSFGGGSPIDAAKSVAFALATGLDMADPRAAENARGLRPASLLPHLAIPTTLSVAELSANAGFSTEGEREKVGLRAEGLVPASVIYDAELSLHTPMELWLSTGIRAVDHAVETLLAPGSHPLQDALALEGLRRLRTGLLASRAHPADLEARTNSQLGAWFSFTLPGPASAGLSHTLSKRLGSRHGIPHGVSSCLLLPHVMRYLAPSHAAALARIAEALGVDPGGPPLERAAMAAGHAVAELIRELGLPQRLSAYGLTDADLLAAATPVASKAYPLEDLLAIYRAAL
jgi:maleylacetate reductase